VVDDGKIVAWFEEPGLNDNGVDDDPYGVSSPENILEWVTANKKPAS
jgi:peroxiredoxin